MPQHFMFLVPVMVQHTITADSLEEAQAKANRFWHVEQGHYIEAAVFVKDADGDAVDEDVVQIGQPTALPRALK